MDGTPKPKLVSIAQCHPTIIPLTSFNISEDFNQVLGEDAGVNCDHVRAASISRLVLYYIVPSYYIVPTWVALVVEAALSRVLGLAILTHLGAGAQGGGILLLTGMDSLITGVSTQTNLFYLLVNLPILDTF